MDDPFRFPIELERKYSFYDNLHIISITWDESITEIREYLNRFNQLPRRVALDVQHNAYNKIMRACGRENAPFYVLVDKSGFIRFCGSYEKAQTSLENCLRDCLDELIEYRESDQPPETEEEKREPRVVFQNRGELMDMKERDLKTILERYQVDYRDCVKKTELVDRILDRCPRAA
jgi:hypothetical protein